MMISNPNRLTNTIRKMISKGRFLGMTGGASQACVSFHILYSQRAHNTVSWVLAEIGCPATTWDHPTGPCRTELTDPIMCLILPILQDTARDTPMHLRIYPV